MQFWLSIWKLVLKSCSLDSCSQVTNSDQSQIDREEKGRQQVNLYGKTQTQSQLQLEYSSYPWEHSSWDCSDTQLAVKKKTSIHSNWHVGSHSCQGLPDWTNLWGWVFHAASVFFVHCVSHGVFLCSDWYCVAPWISTTNSSRFITVKSCALWGELFSGISIYAWPSSYFHTDCFAM